MTTPPSTPTKPDNWVLAATVLASSMAIIDSSALNVALPAIQKSLGADATQLVWVVNAYALMLAALILVGGSLGDHLGRKKIMMIGITLFVICSVACGAAPSIQWLIATRTLQGVGGALMVPGSLAIITAVFEGDKRGRAIGTWSAAGALTVVAGPLLGGVLADAGLWRIIFLLNVPLGVVAWGIISRRVPETRDESAIGALDYGGGLLASLGLAGITYGLTMWSTLGPVSVAVWGTLLAGGLCLAGFVFWEKRHENALVPLSLFRVRTFSGTNLLTLFLYGALSVASFFLSLNLIQVQGYRPALAGLAFFPLPLPLILLARWSGGLSDKYGFRLPLTIGPIITGLGFLWLSLIGQTTGPADYWTTFLPAILTAGFGLTLTVVPLTNAVMGSVASHYAGTASGVNNAVSRTASVLALAVASSVALVIFRQTLTDQLQTLTLGPSVMSTLQAQADQLGGMSVPEELVLVTKPAVRQAIQTLFLRSYQLIIWGCTALAWLSAVMAAVWLTPRPEPLATVPAA